MAPEVADNNNKTYKNVYDGKIADIWYVFVGEEAQTNVLQNTYVASHTQQELWCHAVHHAGGSIPL